MRRACFTLLLVGGCGLLTSPDDKPPILQVMKLLWEIPYEFVGTAVTATPLMLGDSLVIMSAGKEILAVNQQTGTVRWRSFVSDKTNIQTDEFKTDGYRVFASHVEDIRAYSLADGSIQWKTDMVTERGGFWSHEMTYSAGKVMIAGYRTVYALDALTGSMIWSKNLQLRGVLGDTKMYDGSIIVGGSYGFDDSSGKLIGSIGKLYSLNVATGDTNWTVTMRGDGAAYAPVIEDGVIYVGTAFPFSSASFEAFDARTGARKWSYYTPNEGWDYNYAIVVGDKVIANAGPYHVAAFNKHTGQLLWRTFLMEDAESRKLHFYNGYIYHTQGWNLFVIDPETGRVVHRMKGPKGQALVTIAVGNGRVFVQGHPSLMCFEAYKSLLHE